MNKPLFYRFMIIAGVILLLWIALQMVLGIVRERGQYRDVAERSIWQSYAGPQTLTGPVIVVPYKEVIAVTGTMPAQSHEESRQLLVFPKTLQVRAEMTPSERYRGIHKAIVYETASQWSGTIALPDPTSAEDLRKSVGHVRFEMGQPYVVLGVGDMRGLISQPVLQLDGKPVPLQQGTLLDALPQGLHAPIDTRDAAGKPLESRIVPFQLTLSILGARSMAMAPVADLNQFTVRSPWPHPSFDGDFLPRQRTVTDNGFSAEWSVTAFNTHVREQIANAPESGRMLSLQAPSVTLMEPVDIYVKAERAVKYGLLFVLLTFAGLYMFEIVKALRIHPVQYLLAGLALALFFLLLVSLSEHVPFLSAYLAASAACIGLLGFYLTFVLRSWQRGATFAALLTTLYGVLYGLLASEDSALVLGSLLLFVILACIMTITRKVDWFAMDAPPQADQPGQQGKKTA